MLQTRKQQQDPPALPARHGQGVSQDGEAQGRSTHNSGHSDHPQHCRGLCWQVLPGPRLGAPSQPGSAPRSPCSGWSHLAGSQQPHQLLGDSVPVLLHEAGALVFHLAGDRAGATVTPQPPGLDGCGLCLDTARGFWKKSRRRQSWWWPRCPAPAPPQGCRGEPPYPA